ncbi:ATP-binding cassette domain-containing protein [Aminobacter sp. MSH1]|uniref:ATP-binding cassette domain-containing protein n=1 Tax=Aminobacter sp. MSH1 TaxID=374606 RepID=UPI000D34A872|nr:ATP-binding cassette domain-containing protein [Aminobacter sp. MSH1]
MPALEQMAASPVPVSVSAQDEILLKLEAVWKRFGPVTAVKEVTFAARSGEVHALLGENGAGKSTLMAIAAGDLMADAGTITLCGQPANAVSTKNLLALVHQHPAVFPELTVTENMLLAVPKSLRTGFANDAQWVKAQLDLVGSNANPSARIAEIDIAQSHLIELAKALAIKPKVLVLDEPTAALTADLVEVLFKNIRRVASQGTAVVYISHRLKEIRQIADRVTVMRDGAVQGGGVISELSDDEILQLIVGRSLKHAYPPKAVARQASERHIEIINLTGSAFSDISIRVGAGEIFGIAGISGNGQSEFLRSVAGLVRARSGKISLSGEEMRLNDPAAARAAGIIYLSPERQKEGIFQPLSVRENASISSLHRFARFGIVSRRLEEEAVDEQRQKLNIRAATIEQRITTLSGGNQQKTLMARALLADASAILAEEPTAGIDVGARADIYAILRELADRGTMVILVSSDIVELEGLCDRVAVFSRGQIVAELSGDQVNEGEIGRSMISATTLRQSGVSSSPKPRSILRTLGSSDQVPSVVLALIVVCLALTISSVNPRFLSAFNVEKVLFMSAAVSFVAFGQLCTVLTGRIDLSVGPLVGLSVIVASYFINEGGGGLTLFLGLFLMLVTGAIVGLVNGSLIRFANFTAVAATIGVYIIIQGISLLLRPFPDGMIGSGYMEFMKSTIGGVPMVFVVAAVSGIILDLALVRTRWGMVIRAIGSNEKAAAQIGVNVTAALIGAYVICGMFTAVGGMIIAAMLGIGDANQGTEFTLSSIAAVVLGGASLFGGRGSFTAVMLGALLINQVNSSMVFLGLSQAWQFWFLGLLTIMGVAVYSQAAKSATAR